MKKEIWKNYKFSGVPSYASRVEVSNLGRVRVHSKLSDGKLVKGSLTEGYPRVNFKYFKPRTKPEEKQYNLHRNRMLLERRSLKAMEDNIKLRKKKRESWKQLQQEYSRKTGLYKTNLAKYKVFLRKDEKSRTVYYGIFIHNMVAELFLKKPGKNQPFVIHLDFRKTNNQTSNLKWVSQKELTEHNNYNPKVLRARKDQKGRPNLSAAKLTLNQVKSIKLLLKKGKTLKEIGTRYKVSDMQIYRIKTGENWKRVKV